MNRLILRPTLLAFSLALVLFSSSCGGSASPGSGDAGSSAEGQELSLYWDERCADDSANTPGCAAATRGTVFTSEKWEVKYLGGEAFRLDAAAPAGFEYEWQGPIVALYYVALTSRMDSAVSIDDALEDTTIFSIGAMASCAPQYLPQRLDRIDPGETLVFRFCGSGGSDGEGSANFELWPCESGESCKASLQVYPDQSPNPEVYEQVKASLEAADVAQWEVESQWLRAQRNR